MTWQYDGVAPWNDIIGWCDSHLSRVDGWGTNGHDTIIFVNERDYLLFIMKWMWR
jgi:hypothetical protein